MDEVELTPRDFIAEACRRCGLDADVERDDYDDVVVLQEAAGLYWTFAEAENGSWTVMPSWVAFGTYDHPPEMIEGEEVLCGSLDEALLHFATERARNMMDSTIGGIKMDAQVNAQQGVDPKKLFPAAEEI